MTNKFLATVLVLMASVSYANQNQYDYESVETNNIYNDVESASDIRDPQMARRPHGTNEAIDTANSPQINIYNENANSNKQAQKSHAQTDTDAIVDSAAYSDSKAQSDLSHDYIERANEIRRARKDLEMGTETKMIEKIEWSRIEDEKDRSDRLFGNRLDKKKYDNHYDNNYENNYKPEKEVVIIEKPTPVVPYAPAPVYKEEYKNEVKSDYSYIAESKSYLSPTVGWMTHPSAVNVDEATTFGIAAGTVFSSGVAVEMGLNYANFTMDDYDVYTFNGLPGQKEVDQYSLNGAVRYNFMVGRIVPNVGALLGYSYRDYNETRAFSQGTTSSSAVDAGVSLGVDFKLTQNFSLGVEYRVMRNIWNDREDQDNNQVSPLFYGPFATAQNREKLEEVGYQQFGVNAKFSF